LILQFGAPAEPTLTAFTIGNGTSAGYFRRNRFTGPYAAGDQSYVIDNEYEFTFEYTLDPTNTLVSSSLLTRIDGVITEITKSVSGASSTTLAVDTNNSNIDYLHSGSHLFTASLCVELEDGSLLSKELTSLTSGNTTLNKQDADNPGISAAWTFTIGDSSLATNTGTTSTSTSVIEQGVAGSITYSATAPTTSNGWSKTNDSPNGATTTINQTGTPNTINLTANWNSNGNGTPSTDSTTNSKAFSRIISLRSGASANSSSFSAAELLDVDTWEGGSEVEDGNIQFNTTTINNGTTNVVITNTVDAFYYIIYNDSVGDLTAIRQGSPEGSNVLSSFTKSTVSTTGGLTYKVYKLNSQSSPVTNNTFYLFN
jgi:hypothetical protein